MARPTDTSRTTANMDTHTMARFRVFMAAIMATIADHTFAGLHTMAGRTTPQEGTDSDYEPERTLFSSKRFWVVSQSGCMSNTEQEMGQIAD